MQSFTLESLTALASGQTTIDEIMGKPAPQPAAAPARRHVATGEHVGRKRGMYQGAALFKAIAEWRSLADLGCRSSAEQDRFDLLCATLLASRRTSSKEFLSKRQRIPDVPSIMYADRLRPVKPDYEVWVRFNSRDQLEFVSMGSRPLEGRKADGSTLRNDDSPHYRGFVYRADRQPVAAPALPHALEGNYVTRTTIPFTHTPWSILAMVKSGQLTPLEALEALKAINVH